MSNLNFPFISVIVPVYNDEKRIGLCIKSLLRQSYPLDRFEIIIIDNKSSDKTVEVVKKYPVKLLHENKIQSSYAARNLGVKNSRGDVLVFTDSDCIADKNWLRNGISYILKNNCDILAGDVKFFYKDKNSVFEILDSFIHFNQEIGAKKAKVPTVNVFFKKNIFDKIGLFNSSLKSGADILLSKKAFLSGFIICFCSDSFVYHPTRNFKNLFLKQKRIARDDFSGRLFAGESLLAILFQFFLDFLPQKKFFYKKVKKIDYNKNKTLLSIKLFFANWFIGFSTNICRLYYLKNLIINIFSKNEKN